MPEPLEPLPKSIDLRPWIALLVVAAGVALAVRQWPWMRWLVVVMLALALLRAMGFVLAANALGKDPEKVKENPSEASRKADRPA